LYRLGWGGLRDFCIGKIVLVPAPPPRPPWGGGLEDPPRRTRRPWDPPALARSPEMGPSKLYLHPALGPLQPPSGGQLQEVMGAPRGLPQPRAPPHQRADRGFSPPHSPGPLLCRRMRVRLPPTPAAWPHRLHPGKWRAVRGETPGAVPAPRRGGYGATRVRCPTRSRPPGLAARVEEEG